MKISRVLLMLLLAGASNAEDRSSALLNNRLQQKKAQYSLQAANFLQAVAQFASENEIPIGLEWTEDDATLKPVNLSWHNVAVAEILRGLVKNEPGYESTVDRGVVHIFQRGRMAPNRDFLTVPIELFDVKDDYVRNASAKLRSLVARAMYPPVLSLSSVRAGGVGGHVATGLGDKKIALHFENTDTRHVLDELVLAGELKIWVVTYPDNPRYTTAGYRKSKSIFANAIAPDFQQPMWDLLPWGLDPVSKNLRQDWYYRRLNPPEQPSTTPQ